MARSADRCGGAGAGAARRVGGGGDGGVRRSLPVRGGAALRLAERTDRGATAERPPGDDRPAVRGARDLADPPRWRRPGRPRLRRADTPRRLRRRRRFADRAGLRARAAAGERLHLGIDRRSPALSQDRHAAARRGRAAGPAVGSRAEHPRAGDGAAPPPLRPLVRRAGPVHGRRQLRPHHPPARGDHRRPGARVACRRRVQRPRAPAGGRGAAARRAAAAPAHLLLGRAARRRHRRRRHRAGGHSRDRGAGFVGDGRDRLARERGPR